MTVQAVSAEGWMRDPGQKELQALKREQFPVAGGSERLPAGASKARPCYSVHLIRQTNEGRKSPGAKHSNCPANLSCPESGHAKHMTSGPPHGTLPGPAGT